MTLANALEGIRVLDLSRLLPGPFLTMILGDMGADVVKVEDPRMGDYMRNFPPSKGGMSGRFHSVNRNKRSVTMDLKTDAERDKFLKMVAKADIVVETFRPGVMERLGVGYEALKAANPKIVLCSISGYGKDGPYVARAGHDLNYLALGGVVAMSAEAAGHKPSMAGVQIADVCGGSMWGAISVLGAIIQRDRTGEGAHLDISMTEGAMAMLCTEFGNMDAGGDVPTRGTSMLNGAVACYAVYETKDGKYMTVGSLEPKFWANLGKAIGRDMDFSEVVAPAAVQDKVRGELQEIFLTKTRDEWTKILEDHDCCCEPVLELDEVMEHPLHKARNMFFTMDGGDMGPVLQMRTPTGMPPQKRIAPRQGEHNAEVFAEYGVD